MPENEKWTSTVKNELLKSLITALDKLESENRELRERADKKSTSSADMSEERLRDEVAKINAAIFGDEYPSNTRGAGDENER